MFTPLQTHIHQWSKIKDKILYKELHEQLRNDIRLHNIPISFIISQGVAQIEGEINSVKEQGIIRQVFSQHDGLYAVWDLLTIKGKKPAVADIGCGTTKQTSQGIGVDKLALPGVDVVTDLEKPLPLPDNSFDIIFAIHVLEHIHHLIDLMNDLHRLLRRHGILHIITPQWHSPTAVADPTHVRLLNPHTLKFFCEKNMVFLPGDP